MAITELTSNASTADATSFTTASVSPAANALILLAVRNTPIDTPVPTGGGMTTWDTVATTVEAGGSTSRVTLFRAKQASPGSGTITLDFGASTQTSCHWSVVEWTDVDDSGGSNGSAAVVQSDTNGAASGTSLAMALSAFGSANNGTYACIAHAANEATTSEGGWSQLSNRAVGAPVGALCTQVLATNDTTPSASWATSSRNAGIAIEVKAAAGGRTTKNTRAFPLGERVGMGFGMAGK